MLVSERRARIVEMLRERRNVSTEEFAIALEVSTETIRRDLLALDTAGVLDRVHGGASSAISARTDDEASFTIRSGSERAAKLRMATAAAKLVRSGQTIVIDVGTSAAAVARALPYDLECVVATNSLLVAAELADRPKIEVLVSGGRLRAGDLALSNAQTNAFFAEIFADLAFLGSGGVDAAAGLTDFHLDEAAVRRVILGNAAQSFVLADASKFGRIARHHIADLGELSGLITDLAPPADIECAVTAAHGVVIVG